MITHLEPDILECEVKRDVASITMNNASGSDGISVELFQILEEKLNKEDGSEGFLHNRSHEEEQPQMGKCAMYSKGKKL